MAHTAKRLHRLLACLVMLATGPALAQERGVPYEICMAVWRGCEEACEGFKDYIAERGIPANIILRDAERDGSRLAGFVREARELNVDLVVTWGTSVTVGMVGTTASVDPEIHLTDIPVVFMIVADPVGAEIVASYETAGRPNVTGTKNRVPEEVQIKAIRAYRHFERLGLIYNTNELNAVLKAEEIRALAGPMGFELIERTIDLDGDGQPVPLSIPAKIAEIRDEGVDFLYVASSSFLMDHRDLFTGAALEAKIPVAAAYEAMALESSALFAVAARYYNVGQLAGFQAEQILVEKARPIDMPLRGLERFSYIVNMETARRLGLYPPLDVLRYAEVVNVAPPQAAACPDLAEPLAQTRGAGVAAGGPGLSLDSRCAM